MRCTTAVQRLLALAAWAAPVQELAAASAQTDTGDTALADSSNSVGEAYDSTDTSAFPLVDSLFSRAHTAFHFHRDLENATLGKSSRLATSPSATTASRALVAPPLRGARPAPGRFLPAPGLGLRRPHVTPDRHMKMKCTIHETFERTDPNLVPGSVKNLKTFDVPVKRDFNEVQVRVYNIDRYGMSPLAAKALKKNIEAIWHVGVAVFGKEYWFGAVVEEQSLSEVDYAFGFGPTHVYNIGKTDMDPKEFHDWVFDKMAKKYTVDSYHCFNHNCHHFANDLVVKLTGKQPADGGFPQWCLDHGEKALSEMSDAQSSAITWVSNRIAKVMMISWGKYNRERFVTKGTTSLSTEGDAERKLTARGDLSPKGTTSLSTG